MPDNLQERGPADRARINVHEEHELEYWTQALGVSRQALLQAVAQVGVMAKDVRRHLRCA